MAMLKGFAQSQWREGGEENNASVAIYVELEDIKHN